MEVLNLTKRRDLSWRSDWGTFGRQRAKAWTKSFVRSFGGRETLDDCVLQVTKPWKGISNRLGFLISPKGVTHTKRRNIIVAQHMKAFFSKLQKKISTTYIRRSLARVQGEIGNSQSLVMVWIISVWIHQHYILILPCFGSALPNHVHFDASISIELGFV